MKLKNIFSYFKKEEERKGLYHINFPLIFLEWVEKGGNKKFSLNRRYLYYPAFFVGFYILLVIGGKYIETVLTFPVVLQEWRNVAGISSQTFPGEEILIPLPGGKQLHGVFVDNKKEKTIFYFHGNGGSLGYFVDDIKFLGNLGYNVMAYDYPGYGKSAGFPLETTVYDSTKTFFERVKQLKDLEDKNIISVGYSIGTAAAVDFASKKSIDSLILIAPLLSRYDMSKDIYGKALQKFFWIPNSMNSGEKMSSISLPTLIIHGNEDAIIPIKQGKGIFRQALSKKKYFIELDSAGHNGILQNYSQFLSEKIHEFLIYHELKRNYFFLTQKGIDLTTSKITIKDTLLKETISLIGQDIPIANRALGTGMTDDIEDYSLEKYVSPQIGFSEKEYTPNNLVKISSEYVFDQKGNTYLRKDSAEALYGMARDFYNTFGTKIGIMSGYRSYAYQKGIKDKGCSDALCANPGHSEHQTGLAIDIFEATNEDTFMKKTNLKNYYWWMKQNAHIYGFHNTYQKGIQIDGYMKEPWHWRYVGIDLATKLHEKNITFAEYYVAKLKAR